MEKERSGMRRAAALSEIVVPGGVRRGTSKGTTGMEEWERYLGTVSAALRDLVVTGANGQLLSAGDGYREWVDATLALRDKGRYLYLVGNGASATMASHMAADAMKNGGIRALTFNDASIVTATANDVSFDEVFSLPLTRLAQPGDMLVTISSSGNSPNIIKALEVARATGLMTITLSGKRPDNQSRRLGHLNFYVPVDRYGWVESSHQVILHYWFDQCLNIGSGGAL